MEHPTRDQIEWLRRSITAVVRDLRIEPGLFLKPSVIDIDVVDSAKRLWKTLGSGKTRTIMDRSAWSFDASQRHETWIHRYLWSRSIQKLAADEIPMTLEDDRQGLAIESDRNERDLLVKARKRLITEMARWQVCIESNPSSNLVVGSLDGMMAQDFLHRRPTSPADQEGEETLTWTISTDDPITFSTTLADEYAYAWAGMVLRKDKPYDPAYARALLDEAAATSMRTRFTIASHGDERESGGKRHGTRTRRHH